MIIGVPRERKDLEKRVAMTPEGVHELRQSGATVLIEQGAGEGSAFPDALYRDAGAEMVASLEEVWKRSRLLVKVKEPAPEETPYFRRDLTAFCFLHLASLPELTNSLLASGITSIAYELVRTASGRFPLLEPMSEVAGKLSVINGSTCLLSQNGGRGMLLGGACGTRPAEVVVLGAGIAGTAAFEQASEMGAQVTVLDINQAKIDAINARGIPRLKALMSNEENRAVSVRGADLLIGAALIPGARPPLLVTEALVKEMKPGSVIVDISIDQGGCIETIRPTSLSAPTYTLHGVIHYGVCNMPAQVPLTSTQALTSQTLPYIKTLAGCADAVELKSKSVELYNAINTQAGLLRNLAVAQALGLTHVPLE